jgi:hypothetical protein
VNPIEPEPVYAYGPPALPPEPGPSKRPVRRTLIVAVIIIAAMAVAGAVLGVVWHMVSPGVPVVNAGANGIVINDPSPEEYIASDSWFTMLTFGFGLVAAIVAWMVARRDRGPAVLLGVGLGGLVHSVMAWQVGRLWGLSAWNDWKSASAAGDTFQQPPDLHAKGALLVAAFGAVIVITLLAGWSNDPDLDVPGAKPGYGPNSEFSSGSPAAPGPTAEPAPPAPSPADPPRG